MSSESEFYPRNIMTSNQQNRHILVVEDPTFKKTVVLDNPTYSVGRHSSNDIVFFFF